MLNQLANSDMRHHIAIYMIHISQIRDENGFNSLLQTICLILNTDWCKMMVLAIWWWNWFHRNHGMLDDTRERRFSLWLFFFGRINWSYRIANMYKCLCLFCAGCNSLDLLSNVVRSHMGGTHTHTKANKLEHTNLNEALQFQCMHVINHFHWNFCWQSKQFLINHIWMFGVYAQVILCAPECVEWFDFSLENCSFFDDDSSDWNKNLKKRIAYIQVKSIHAANCYGHSNHRRWFGCILSETKEREGDRKCIYMNETIRHMQQHQWRLYL